MSFENLLDGLPGRELLKDQLNGDARAYNDRFAHHYMRVRLNQLRLHNGSDYTLNAHKHRTTMIPSFVLLRMSWAWHSRKALPSFSLSRSLISHFFLYPEIE